MENLSKYMKKQKLFVVITFGQDKVIEFPVTAAPNNAYELKNDVITLPGYDLKIEKKAISRLEVWTDDWDEVFEQTDF